QESYKTHNRNEIYSLTASLLKIIIMKIRHIILALAFVIISSATAFAQRFAYVNSEYILEHIPEYVSAQKQLDALSIQWQEEVDSQFAEIEKLYQAYQQDQVVLTESLRRKREDEIVN